MSLVDTSWLENNLNNVKIIDCSWHMPQTSRNGFEEFKKQHIPNSIFFDLDKNSKLNTDLPHMLTDKISWEKIVSEMGIKNEDKIQCVVSELPLEKAFPLGQAQEPQLWDYADGVNTLSFLSNLP